jgi:hypothetical protein
MLPAAADETWGIPPTTGLVMVAVAVAASQKVSLAGWADRWLQQQIEDWFRDTKRTVR